MAINGEQLNLVQHYFAEMTHFPRLSDADVQALCDSIMIAQRQQQAHTEAQARQRLVEGLLYIVLPTAQKYAPRMKYVTLLDLIQEGNYALTLASHRYDFSDTTRCFGSYALLYIRGLIKRDLHKDAGISIPSASFYAQRAKGQLDPILTFAPTSLDAVRCGKDDTGTLLNTLAAPPLYLSSDSAVTQSTQYVHTQVQSMLAGLDIREQQILRLRYGLDEHDGRTLDRDDIARELGLSVAQVTNIELNALRRLRKCMGIIYTSTSPKVQQYHQRRKQEQQARLQAVYEQMQAQGNPGPITCDALCAVAHVGKGAAAAFLRLQYGNEKRARVDRSISPQERLQAAYTQLVECGECLSVPRLKATARVGSTAARQFLRSQGVPPQQGGRRKANNP